MVETIPVFEASGCDDGDRRFTPGVVLPDGHELIALREWKRAQDDGVDGGEDGGVGADAERKREDDSYGEPRCLAQKAKGGAGVEAGGFEERGSVNFAKLLGDLLAAAEVDPGFAAGFFGREAPGFIVAGEGVDVEGNLAMEIVLVIAT